MEAVNNGCILVFNAYDLKRKSIRLYNYNEKKKGREIRQREKNARIEKQKQDGNINGARCARPRV